MNLRRLSLALAILSVSACSNNPSVGSTPGGPNPGSVLVTVTVGGVPASGINVVLSTQLSGAAPVPGTILQTVTTGAGGQVTIGGLPATGTLCLSASQSTSGYAAAVGACHSQPIPSSATLNFPKS